MEENKEKTRVHSKRRKFWKPISYRAYIDERGKNRYEIRNKHEATNPLELLNEYYSIENSEAEEADAQAPPDKQFAGLGKRVHSSKSKFEDANKHKKQGKYLDPETGAYFDNLDEFKMIRALRAQDALEKMASQKSVLKSLFMAKKKKLNYFHHELNNN